MNPTIEASGDKKKPALPKASGDKKKTALPLREVVRIESVSVSSCPFFRFVLFLFVSFGPFLDNRF